MESNTIKQFLTLCLIGGWDKEKAMKHAQKKYQLARFEDITETQLATLIIAMKEGIQKKRIQQLLHNPLRARLFDQKTGKMLYNRTATVDKVGDLFFYFPVGYMIGRETVQQNEIDIMLGVGKNDSNGQEVYHYDILQEKEGDIWLVEFDKEKLQWIGVNMNTDEKRPLYLLKVPTVIGSVYTETIV